MTLPAQRLTFVLQRNHNEAAVMQAAWVTMMRIVLHQPKEARRWSVMSYCFAILHAVKRLCALPGHQKLDYRIQ